PRQQSGRELASPFCCFCQPHNDVHAQSKPGGVPARFPARSSDSATEGRTIARDLHEPPCAKLGFVCDAWSEALAQFETRHLAVRTTPPSDTSSTRSTSSRRAGGPRDPQIRRKSDMDPRPAHLLDPELLVGRDAVAGSLLNRSYVLSGINDLAFVDLEL